MTTMETRPAKRCSGDVSVPGDKSIAHRAALLGAISEGTSVIADYPRGADCQSTLGCLETLGVGIARRSDAIEITGRGAGGFREPAEPLDCGNSGTTVRLISGLLAGHRFTSRLEGDRSLCRRPMRRIVEPLTRFGARIQTVDGHLPLEITGGRLRAIEYALPVPSAQVKSAVLLAGLLAEGTTAVIEGVTTRDHTEVALRASGAPIRVVVEGHARRIEVDGGGRLEARSLRVPGDASSAAFLVAAALLLEGSELHIRGVGINPTRTDYLRLVRRMGGDIEVVSPADDGGERSGDIVVRGSALTGLRIEPDDVAGVIDEIPILAVLGVCGGGSVSIRGAGELRHKESDRLRAIAVNLAAIGASVEETEDGLDARSDGPLAGGTVSSFGDHRIAMAFAVAGLASRQGVRVEDAGSVDISFPGFFDRLESIVER